MPSFCISIALKVAWFAGSLRNAASITVRALYRARSVRADRPRVPRVVW